MIIIPDADPLALPAPPWLLWALLILTFSLHVLAMNFVLGGSIFAAVARLRGTDDTLRVARAFGKLMPTMVAAAITLGVAPLLFLQTLYGRLFFSSAVLIAWFWLAIIPALIFGYYGTYWIAFHEKKPAASRYALLATVIAILFVAIAFVQSTNMTLMLRADQFLPKFLGNARGTQLNTDDPTFLARWLHMLFGAIALGGFFVALYGRFTRDDERHASWAMRHGALWFTGATVAGTFAGLWWLGALPREVLLRFMGQDLLSSLSLALGITLGFVTLGMMVMAIGIANPARLVTYSTWTLLGTIVAMVLARDGVRRGMLARANFIQTTWIEPQWAVITIFLVLLVATAATTAWMASLLLRTREPHW